MSMDEKLIAFGVLCVAWLLGCYGILAKMARFEVERYGFVALSDFSDEHVEIYVLCEYAIKLLVFVGLWWYFIAEYGWVAGGALGGVAAWILAGIMRALWALALTIGAMIAAVVVLFA